MPSTISRVFHHKNGRTVFDARELAIMGSPSKRLNDVCINGIATIFLNEFSQSTSPSFDHSRRCALFSTHDLPMVQYHATDSELWRRSKRTEYWTHDIWILPIHRSRSCEHWVMCTVSLATRELFLFDSLAAQAPWKREIPVCYLFELH